MTLNGLPCVDLSDVNENRLLRWQRVEQIRQHFWRRWSNEYLHSLKVRTKWMANKGTQLSINQLVLIRQPNLAPLQWGESRRFISVLDDIARTATVKIAKSSYIRPLSKQYYQLKPSPCIIKHLGLSVFSCYLLIISHASFFSNKNDLLYCFSVCVLRC